MSKNLLSEGFFDKILSLLSINKTNKAINTLKKDPELKQAFSDYQESVERVRKALKDYESKYNG